MTGHGRRFPVGFTLVFLLVAVLPAHLRADGPVSDKCPHVTILTRGQSNLVEEPYRLKIVTPGPNQQLALKMALDALPPVVCQSVQIAVFLNAALESAPEALAWVDRNRPALVNISALPGAASEERLAVDLNDIESMTPEKNQERRATLVRVWPEVIHSIIHEIYHSASNLFDSFMPDPYELLPDHGWPDSARQFARPFVEKAGLMKTGIRSEWKRINEEFEDHEFSDAYDKNRVGRKQEPPLGFMTIYGGKSVSEDIAEAASWAVAIPILESSYGGVRADISEWNYACNKMRANQDTGIPPIYAALYTKLSFLRDVGFITDETLEGCAGSIGLSDTGSENGFYYRNYKTDAPLTEYNTDFKITRKPESLHLSAWGNLHLKDKSLPAVTQLEFWVEDPSLPRGLYAIDHCNDFVPRAAASTVAPAMFRRDVIDNRSQSICANIAMVLVTSATTDRIEGSAVLQKAWKFSSPPVWETGGFPARVIFRYKR